MLEGMGRRTTGAVAGVLAGAVALGVAELAAAFVRPESAPVEAVGAGVVRLTPAAVKDFAIRTFGAYDKTALIVGILVLLVPIAALLGMLAARRRWIGMLGFAAFGLLGVVAAAVQPDAGPLDPVPSLVGAVVGLGTLGLLLRTPDPEITPEGYERRRFLALAGASVAAAALAGYGGRALQKARFAADRSRAAVRIPRAASPAPPVPAGADLRLPGLSPWRTGDADFYRVDTALTLPQVAAETWRLTVHGRVDHPVTLTYEELLKRPLIERDITLCCVSNPVGGPYIGNARWTGVRLADLLREAGVHPDADQIVSRSADGMTIGTPTAVVLDGRDAMLAVAMNGVPLPIKHGFPVRMLVPGLYGYVSACKWLVDLELTTFADYDAYWVPRGYSAQAPVKTESRIDTPRDGARRPAGRVAVAGVAWAQHKGISRVEVRVDDGPWRPARLAPVPTADTWRQWVYDWDATPGDHVLRVRATDSTGYTQTGAQADVAPNGATGWHSASVTVG
ncbi:sulfite oxidase [Actinocatenispora rupis]|uniref:Oxidoreductase n=2 Tax=Actinocatenispora rupis TaxID=519421 RepID=A0A8J3JFW9_9ACTN|nr:oxidoreductase [Actinocatenispora rupis]